MPLSIRPWPKFTTVSAAMPRQRSKFSGRAPGPLGHWQEPCHARTSRQSPPSDVLPKSHSATRRQVGQAGSRPSENFNETAKPKLRKVRPTTLIASRDGFCCVQSAQGSRNVIEFEMPYSKPRTLCIARANSGLGIRSGGGFSFAAAVFVLWAGTLPAQQASHESNWNPE